MARTLTASDRSALLKMASKMPVGSPERKAILAGLSKSAAKLYDIGWEWPFEFDFKGVDGEQYSVAGAVKDGLRPQKVQYYSIFRLDEEDDEFVPVDIEDFERTHNHHLAFRIISKDVKRRGDRRASGRQKESRFQQWGKSASADVMRNWRSKDTPAEQQEVLGQAMAESYEVVQTVLMLAKKTEGVDPQSVNKALRSLGAAMFDL